MHILKKGSELLIRSLLKKPSFSQISQDLELSFSLSADRHTIFAQKKMRRSWNYRARINYSIWLTIYIYREREVLDRMMMMMACMPVLAYYSSTTTKVLSA